MASKRAVLTARFRLADCACSEAEDSPPPPPSPSSSSSPSMATAAAAPEPVATRLMDVRKRGSLASFATLYWAAIAVLAPKGTEEKVGGSMMDR